MASISEPYTITTLPRTSLLNPSQICVASELHDRESNHIDLGVSGSVMGTYILRPTPKLIWSHAVSPSTVISSLTQFVNSEGTKRFIYGSTDRKKYKLSLVEKREHTLSGEDEHKQTTVALKNSNISANVSGLKFSQNGNYFYSLLVNGEIAVHKFVIEDDESLEPLQRIEGIKRRKVVFHKFIHEINGTEVANVDSYLLTVQSTSGKFLSVKIFALMNASDILTISESNIEFSSDNFTVGYDISGHLVIYDIDQQTISIYSLPNARLIKKIAISNRVKELGQVTAEQVSMLIPAPNRVLLCIEKIILLIDSQFEAVLDAFNLPSGSTASLLTCPSVKGNSLRTKETVFLALVTDSTEGLTTVQNFTVDVGLGTLSYSLGKGINRVQKKTLKDEEFFQNEVTGLSSFIDEQEVENETFFLENSKSSKDELFEVYKQLDAAKRANDIPKWERIFLSYIKGSSLKEISNKGSSALSNGKQEFQVFELEKDRIIDSRFFYKVASLIFTKNDDKQITLVSKDFVPEKTLTYLLTHPLFPMEFSNGLLQSLHKFPRLVRQAIVTCPNLSCFELIQQLNVIDNEDIFKDLIIRLSEEYSSEKITSETTKIINTNSKKRRKSLQATFDLDKIISKIINLNFGFEILNSFIDSNGLILSLHYSKNENNLEKLIHKIDNKTDSLLTNSQLLTLVEQSIINSNHTGSKKSNKKKKKAQAHQQEQAKKLKPLTISEDVDDTKAKLDSMLSIDKSNNINEVLLTNRNNNVVDQLNKKVPSYSVDKLIL